MSSPARLPFDQYQRYRLVADVLERLRPLAGDAGAALQVLDVGGRTGLLARFDELDRITAVDLEVAEGTPRLVLGDGSRLPFRDGAFDAVCAFDTLEHVPPDLRAEFVGECRRVSRRWVVLAGPCDSPEVRRAERLLQTFLAEKLDFRHRYLEEHRRFGLPQLHMLQERLRGLGGEVLVVGHGNVDRWLALLCLSMYLDRDPQLHKLAPALFEFYNRRLYASDSVEPVYRHVVVGAFDGAPLPSLEGVLQPPQPPQAASEAFAELVRETLAYDLARQAWNREREAFEERVATLELDLAGHRETLPEVQEEVQSRRQAEEILRADLLQHQASLRELQVDLEEHRRSLREQERELVALRQVESTLRAVHTEQTAVIADLRSDLEGHRAVLEHNRRELQTTGEVLAAVYVEREALQQTVAELRRDLDGHRVALSDARGQLGAARASREELIVELHAEQQRGREAAEALERDLAGHREALADRERRLVEHAEVLAHREERIARLEQELRAEGREP